MAAAVLVIMVEDRGANMFGFRFRDPDREEIQTANITQFNMMLLGELGKIYRRLEVLEADLAARKAKEVEEEAERKKRIARAEAERLQRYHGIPIQE